MKKGLIAVILLAAFCFANVALAAADPFSDVPAKHWAYDALNKLAKAGIVTGFGDGTFRGDRVMSRFEMAMIVGNAMTKAEQTDAENKALINKLATEFADELKTLGKRVEVLEKNQSSLKISGFFQSRYVWVQHPRPSLLGSATEDPARSGVSDTSNTLSNSIWLFVDNKFDGKTYFHGLLENESVSGRSTNSTINTLEAFVATKMGGTEVGIGRFFPSMGMGFFGSPWMDGVRVSFGNDVKVRLFSTKLLTDVGYTDSTYTTRAYGSATYNMADVNFALGKDTNMSLAYVSNGRTNPYMPIFGNNYRDFAVGMEYKGIPNLNLKSEYAVNSSDYAKSVNNNSSAKAYFVTAKYKGANPFVPGSFGLRVEYKHADEGFDPLSYSAPFEWYAPLNWSQAPQGGKADNMKGFEYGFDYTIATRLTLDVRYDNLKTANGENSTTTSGTTQQNFLSARVTYLF